MTTRSIPARETTAPGPWYPEKAYGMSGTYFIVRRVAKRTRGGEVLRYEHLPADGGRAAQRFDSEEAARAASVKANGSAA